ncbi:hypothetical protein EDF39_0461 [Frondihabitans sp. PhB161]|nr:hypothetical protein EDF37_0460 [Frondihabitans sp. PhB153]RPF08079.1 hypothetical protein EDF39_0461 [Frondihabitans sp. PhB161]
MGGYPQDADAKKAIKALRKDFQWIYDDNVGSSAHICGWLLCRDGCRMRVFSTARNSARAIWSGARKCTHGHAPTRPHW